MQSLCVEMNTTGTYNLYDSWGDLSLRMGMGRIANSVTTMMGKGKRSTRGECAGWTVRPLSCGWDGHWKYMPALGWCRLFL